MIDTSKFTQDTVTMWKLMLDSQTTWTIQRLSRKMNGLSPSNITWKLKPLIKHGYVIKVFRGEYLAVDPTKTSQENN